MSSRAKSIEGNPFGKMACGLDVNFVSSDAGDT